MTKVVILAGGRGTRIAEESDLRPKPMIEIGGRPILWHIMKIYAAYGLREFVICLGYKGWMIRDFFLNYRMHSAEISIETASGAIDVHGAAAEDWRVTLVDTGQATQTGGRLARVARHLTDGPFCMTYGDGVADIDIRALLAFHAGHGRDATVTAVAPPARFGVLRRSGARVEAFREKERPQETTINGGFFVLAPRVLDRIGGDDCVFEREALEGLAADGQLMAYEHAGFWQPMDTVRERNVLEELWSSGRAPWKSW